MVMTQNDDENGNSKPKIKTATRTDSLLNRLRLPENKGDVAVTEQAEPEPSGLADKMRLALTGVGTAPQVQKPDESLHLPERGCLGMIIDATASRDASWRDAKKIQRKLFAEVSASDKMLLRMVVMRGGCYKDYGWQQDAEQLGSLIDNLATVGGNTRIVDSMRSFLNKPDGYKPAAIILIGDCSEDNPDHVRGAARALARQGIRVYAFHETSKTRTRQSILAEPLFKDVASITGGAFAKFGDNMPLGDLCRVVAAYCVGGDDAVKALGHSGDRAAKMLDQPRLMIAAPAKPSTPSNG